MKNIAPSGSRLLAGVWIVALTATSLTIPTAQAALAQQAYLKASNPGASDNFGASVAVSDDTMVVGAPWEDSNATGVNGDQSNNGATRSGAAYVFVRNGTNWTQQAYLKASYAKAGGEFGHSVAISGDTVVVGANLESSNASGVNGSQTNKTAPDSGAAYVFVRSGTNWTQQAYLKASNTGAGDQFGNSVAVSGDTVIVGAWREDSNARGVNGSQTNNNAPFSGAAYVFVRNATNWTQEAYLKASNTDPRDEFGCSVAISGDTVVVGAQGESSIATGANGNQSDNSARESGATYVFVRSGTIWTQQAYLKASNTGPGDWFGSSVAVWGDTIVAGAWRSISPGAAYVFARSGTTWSQQAYLKASNAESADYFGSSTAISGDTVVIGAFGENGNATGVNGDQSDNSAPNSGAAYVFVRNGTTWTQQAYLKASNTGPGDSFGGFLFTIRYSGGPGVAVSGDTIGVGAPFEDSNATGVNGDQSNNSAGNAGAAYVFTGVCPACPTVAFAPDGNGGYVIRFNATPGSTHLLQRTGNLTSSWPTIATLTAPASGLIEYPIGPPPSGAAFYRTVPP